MTNRKESEDTNGQNTVLDDQNYEINVEQINADFIKQIDAIRSKVDPRTIFTGNVIKSASIGAVDSKIEIKDNEYPYESRCSAFYRLIGLPVVDPDNGNFYNPGFNKEVYAQEELKNSRISIANYMLSYSSGNFVKILDARSDNPKKYQNYFSKQDINSSLAALSSSNQNNIRKFTAALENTKFGNPYENADQKYEIQLKNSRNEDLLEYKDLDSGFTDTDFAFISENHSRSHILKPFLTDPRIDFSVIPSKNRVAAPFLRSKNDLKISEDVYLQRPYIENICRIRFDNLNKTSQLTDSQKQTLEDIKNNPSFKDDESLKKYTDATVNESEQFLKFYNVFKAMCIALRDAVETVKITEQQYNWMPIPDKRGPEFGSTTLPVTSNAKDGSPLFKIIEDEIANKTTQSDLDLILTKVIGNDTKDLGDFALGGVSLTQNSPDPETSRSFGDHNSIDLEKMIKAREDQCQKANNAIKTIEIILGEFSGFGFCDIMAIYASLWLIEPQYLEGFLDDNAWSMSQEATGYTPLTKSIGDRPKITECLSQFESKIKEMYQLMQKIYIDLEENNSKSSS